MACNCNIRFLEVRKPLLEKFEKEVVQHLNGKGKGTAINLRRLVFNLAKDALNKSETEGDVKSLYAALDMEHPDANKQKDWPLVKLPQDKLEFYGGFLAMGKMKEWEQKQAAAIQAVIKETRDLVRERAIQHMTETTNEFARCTKQVGIALAQHEELAIRTIEHSYDAQRKSMRQLGAELRQDALDEFLEEASILVTIELPAKKLGVTELRCRLSKFWTERSAWVEAEMMRKMKVPEFQLALQRAERGKLFQRFSNARMADLNKTVRTLNGDLHVHVIQDDDGNANQISVKFLSEEESAAREAKASEEAGKVDT